MGCGYEVFKVRLAGGVHGEIASGETVTSEACPFWAN